MTPDLPWLTPPIQTVQARHANRLARLYAGEISNPPMTICGPWCGKSHGLHGINEIDMLEQPEAWLADVLTDMAAKANLAGDEVNYRPLAIDIDPLGVHFIDALLGIPTRFHAGQVWAEQFQGDLDELGMPDLDRCPILHKALRLAAMAAELSAGRLLVTNTVTSCPINIGMNLFGGRLLEALVARPGAARRVLRIITDVIVAVIGEFRKVIPDLIRRASVVSDRCAPPGYGYVDGCATQLISAGHYQEFFAALDEEVLLANPNGGMIHLCGACGQHIPTWRAMRALKSVQLNDRAADDLELYLAGLRADQILYVAPTRRYPARHIMELTAGRAVVLQCPLPEA